MKKTIAIFDLDKTLIPFDCDEAWGQFLYARGLAEHDFLSRQAAFFAQYDAGTLTFMSTKGFPSRPLSKPDRFWHNRHWRSLLSNACAPA